MNVFSTVAPVSILGRTHWPVAATASRQEFNMERKISQKKKVKVKKANLKSQIKKIAESLECERV